MVRDTSTDSAYPLPKKCIGVTVHRVEEATPNVALLNLILAWMTRLSVAENE